jgi:DNA polymerase-4
MARTILHFDLDAFFCSVEEQFRPDLKGKPFVVAGSPRRRGVVSSASYPARRFGIRSAMPTAQALRLCPDLIVVPPRHGVYGERSREVMELLREAAPVVEQISIDEAFLDVSDDPRGGKQIAQALQAEIEKRFALPTSWGVATNKLVAKIATEVGKPRGVVVVPPGEEASFLAPLPLEMLWGVGPKTAQILQSFGMATIGDLANFPDDRLVEHFGTRGRELVAHAQGIDDSPLSQAREARSMSAETTFPRDVQSAEALRRTLRGLSEQVGARLRKENLAGMTVRVKLRWPDFTTLTRQKRLAQPTNQDREIFEQSWDLMQAVWRPGKKVRLLGVGLSDLGPPIRQLEMFDHARERDGRLLRAIDEIRSRYGARAVRRASTVLDDGKGENESHKPGA